MTTSLHIAVACGGTGGHIFPGLATALELKKRGHTVTLWLTGRDTEILALKDWTGPRISVPARGFPSGFSWKSIQTAFHLLGSVWQCRKEMKASRPDALLAMGAYASVGPCGAAMLLKIPFVLHEANVIPGRAVRLFAKRAAVVAAGFEETRAYLPGVDLQVVGMPLRNELTLAAKDLPPPTPWTTRPFRILVMGGSMGAHRLNQVVSEAIRNLAKNQVAVEVFHLAGKNDVDAIRETYCEANIPAQVEAFASNMAPFYSAVDFAICRAGAITCAELTLFGIPALFVPYPHAAKGHQTANARALEKRGVADVIAEEALSAEWLEAYLLQTIRKPERLERLRKEMSSVGIPNGTAALADCLESIARHTATSPAPSS